MKRLTKTDLEALRFIAIPELAALRQEAEVRFPLPAPKVLSIDEEPAAA